MSYSPFPAFRPEVQAYLRACEYLVSGANLPNSPPFSFEEVEMMEYYVAEVAKILEVSTDARLQQSMVPGASPSDSDEVRLP